MKRSQLYMRKKLLLLIIVSMLLLPGCSSIETNTENTDTMSYDVTVQSDSAVSVTSAEQFSETVCVTESFTEEPTPEESADLREKRLFCSTKPDFYYSYMFSEYRNFSDKTGDIVRQAAVEKDGYFQFDFLKDKEFESLINSDIRLAADNLRKQYSGEYCNVSESASPFNMYHCSYSQQDGMGFAFTCLNGYLSVVMFYAESDDDGETGQEADNSYSSYELNQAAEKIRILHAVTLNYDIISSRKIMKFSELVKDGEDWKDSLNNAVSELSEAGSGEYSSEPGMYTAEFILNENEDGCTITYYYGKSLHLSYASHFRVSDFRDITDAVTYPFQTEREYLLFSQKPRIYTCEKCMKNTYAGSFISSRFFDDELINKRNTQLETLLNEESARCSEDDLTYPKDVRKFSPPEQVSRSFKLNLWCGFLAGDCYISYFYDPDTLERLKADDVLGPDWRNYVISSETDTDLDTINPDFRAEIQIPENDDELVRASIWYYEDGQNKIITVMIPLSELPQKYTDIPEGFLQHDLSDIPKKDYPDIWS